MQIHVEFYQFLKFNIQWIKIVFIIVLICISLAAKESEMSVNVDHLFFLYFLWSAWWWSLLIVFVFIPSFSSWFLSIHYIFGILFHSLLHNEFWKLLFVLSPHKTKYSTLSPTQKAHLCSFLINYPSLKPKGNHSLISREAFTTHQIRLSWINRMHSFVKTSFCSIYKFYDSPM